MRLQINKYKRVGKRGIKMKMNFMKKNIFIVALLANLVGMFGCVLQAAVAIYRHVPVRQIREKPMFGRGYTCCTGSVPFEQVMFMPEFFYEDMPAAGWDSRIKEQCPMSFIEIGLPQEFAKKVKQKFGESVLVCNDESKKNILAFGFNFDRKINKYGIAKYDYDLKNKNAWTMLSFIMDNYNEIKNDLSLTSMWHIKEELKFLHYYFRRKKLSDEARLVIEKAKKAKELYEVKKQELRIKHEQEIGNQLQEIEKIKGQMETVLKVNNEREQKKLEDQKVEDEKKKLEEERIKKEKYETLFLTKIKIFCSKHKIGLIGTGATLGATFFIGLALLAIHYIAKSKDEAIPAWLKPLVTKIKNLDTKIKNNKAVLATIGALVFVAMIGVSWGVDVLVARKQA